MQVSIALSAIVDYISTPITLKHLISMCNNLFVSRIAMLSLQAQLMILTLDTVNCVELIAFLALQRKDVMTVVIQAKLQQLTTR